MSSDNYYVVRKDPKRRDWVVTMGSASSEVEPCQLETETGDPRFKKHREALQYAFTNYSEYGVIEAEWCGGVGHVKNCPVRGGGSNLPK